MSEPDLTSVMVCSGCGNAVDADEPLPFACPHARPGDDVDHVLGPMRPVRGADPPPLDPLDGDPSPFVRYRFLTHSYRYARAAGMSDGELVTVVRDLDRRVAEFEGHGFTTTPFFYARDLGVWLKDETGQVSGSHKARHLMGIALHLEIVERLGRADVRDRELAIASCGNAAVAAAVVSRAAGRRLRVFVPPWAPPSVVARLDALGAERVVCERTPDLPPGDPCYHRFRDALAGGAIPFTCQGNENALALAGGEGLGFELAQQVCASGPGHLDAVAIQVGGGALASSVASALHLAAELGVATRRPRLYAVQTDNVHPLYDAWRRVVERARAGDGDGAMDYARAHRSEFMRPWPREPHSIADGIVDDETYDWAAVVSHVIASGGEVVLASEARLRDARERAERATGIPVSATGSAGLAGVLALRERGILSKRDHVAVLFTGAQR